MALYTNEINRSKDTSKQRARNARFITAGSTVLMFMLLLGGFIATAVSGQTIDFRFGGLTFIGAIIATFFVYRGKTFAGIAILLIALRMGSALLITARSNVGAASTIIMFFVSLGIVLETLTSRENRWVIPTLLVIDLGLVVLDQFWPGYRPPVTVIGAAMLTVSAVVVVIIAIVVIARQFSGYSLRGKLVSATITVALLAVMAVAVGINLLAGRTISQEVGHNLNTLAGSHALSIGEFLARKINTLETLAINRVIVSGALERRGSYEANTRQEIEAQLKALDKTWTNRPDDDPLVAGILDNELVPELTQFLTVFPDNINLLVADQFGAPVAATYRPESYYQGNAKWWRDAYMSGFGSSYIGRPEFDVERDTWTVDMAVPIRGEVETGRTQIVGILHATFSLDALADIMAAARFGETGEIEIHLPGTQVLAVEDGKLVLGTNELRPVVEQMRQDRELYTEFNHRGTGMLLSAAEVSTLAHEPVVDATNWQVVARQDKAEGLKPVSQQGRFNTILGVIVIFSAGVVAWIVGTRLTKPITSLTETAVQVSQGNLEARSEVQSEDELGTLAATFNAMTDQLQGAINNLERRVAERTQALAISIDVGRRLLTIHDQDELVTEVVEEVRDAFDYYHVHIYLLDEDGETLTMAGGTGEAGRTMLDNQHQIDLGQGLVGRAAATNTVVLVPDVTQEEGWLPNELLPETKAEAAVPISIGDEVLGVLDVQVNQVNGLERADTDVLLSITNQVAIALQNARLLEGERERSENEARINEITQKLLRTTTIEAALQVAAREIGRAVDAPQTRVVLKPGNGNNGRHS